MSFTRFCFYSFLILFSFFSAAFFYAYSLLKKPVVSAPTLFLVNRGESIDHVLKRLNTLHFVPHVQLMKLYIKLNSTKELKFGEYEFQTGKTILDIWNQLENGRGLHQRSITFIPGSTFSQIKMALKNAEGIVYTLNDSKSDQLMEGRIFPDTYHYTWGTRDDVILHHAAALMEKKLMNAWVNRVPNLPFQQPDQALIAASLVEKEAQSNEERPLIASVLVNRLRAGMKLQFDPTVIYALGTSYRGMLYKSDLETKNAYNTYVHQGLPPTPIAIPSEASIQAVLHPKETSFLYFVARPDHSGLHFFSSKLDQHRRAVTLYRARTNAFVNDQLLLKYVRNHFKKRELFQ